MWAVERGFGYILLELYNTRACKRHGGGIQACTLRALLSRIAPRPIKILKKPPMLSLLALNLLKPQTPKKQAHQPPNPTPQTPEISKATS